MTELEQLNTSRFFCKCGMGPAGNCTAPHVVVNELSQPGSRARAIVILTLAIGAMVVAVGLFSAYQS